MHSNSISSAITRVVIVALILTGCLFLPPVFSRLLSIQPLLTPEYNSLWMLSAIVISTGFLLLVFYKDLPARSNWIFFALLVAFWIEIITRAGIILARPDLHRNLGQMALQTYPEYSAFKAHPFLQFTGRQLENHAFLSLPYNKFGFIPGKADFEYQKNAGVIRVAALGGSTTESGYPQFMQDALNFMDKASRWKYETLNFGVSWYTTAHSVVNLILNVVDFDPDYIVIHHAWNDNIVRDTGKAFRSDYSHALKPFRIPEKSFFDLWLLRSSVLYRLIKINIAPEHPWTPLGAAIAHPEASYWIKKSKATRWDNINELNAYRRNIETMIEFSLIRGITPVLTTQPHTTNTAALFYVNAEHIDQCNSILRDIARKFGDKIIFADLDRDMTGKYNELFLDVAHVNKDGRVFKAEYIANRIIRHKRKMQQRTTE